MINPRRPFGEQLDMQFKLMQLLNELRNLQDQELIEDVFLYTITSNYNSRPNSRSLTIQITRTIVIDSVIPCQQKY